MNVVAPASPAGERAWRGVLASRRLRSRGDRDLLDVPAADRGVQRVSGIRALERADLPGVSALYEQVMWSGEHTPTSRVAGYFERVFLDDPWADPEIPPLVYEAPDGEIVGFIGASTRRMRLDGRPVRMAVSSNLVAHPDWRSRGIGALLNRRLLRGPQELTVADRANESSRALWLGLGGQELVHASIGWYRILRPGATVGALLDRRGRRGVLRTGSRLATRPLDAISARLPRLGAALVPAEPEGETEPLTTQALLEQIARLGHRLRLHPDYDAEYLGWVFGELDALRSRGRLTARLVRGAGGRVLGWFLYLLPDRGVAEVLQVGVAGSDPVPVLDHLFWQAHRDGAAAVQGRLEPVTAGLLGRPGVVLRKTARALVHADDPAVLGLLGSTTSLLSHLDGEWLVSHGRRQ